MASYNYTFTSGDTVTPTKLNSARTVSDIVNADIKSDASIALSKLATGALPTGITVASANLVDGTIVNADINASAAIAGSKLADGAITNAKVDDAAAIAGTKIAPDFGSQNIVTTGNSGVGTATVESGFKLHVAGNAFIAGASGTTTKTVIDTADQRLVLGSYFESGVGQHAFIASTDNAETGNLPLLFQTGTTERMRINASGNVGVGTTSPATRLDVNGDVTITDKIIHSGDTNTAIRFPANDTVAIETGGSERMRIDASGNLGIGVSSPKEALHVNGGIIQVTNSFIGSNLYYDDYDGSWKYIGDGYGGALKLANAPNGGFAFFIAGNNTSGADASATVTSPVLIDASGSVGINTGSPASRLHVEGDVTISDKIIHSGDTNTAIRFPANDTVAVETGGSERMRIDSSGNLLVNSTAAWTPTAQSNSLYLTRPDASSLFIRRGDDGNVAGFYHGTNTYVGSISITSTATAFNESSDYRLKQNIEPMAGGLAKLMQLQPRTYEFIVEPEIRVDGFIAHEVQEVVPRAVTGVKDGEDMQGLDMSKLVPVLVAAVQELSAKVDALEAAQ